MFTQRHIIKTVYINTECVKNASTNFRNEFPTPEKRIKIHIDACPPTDFRGTVQHLSPDFSASDFYLWGHLKTLVYSGAVESEETIHKHNFIMPVKTFATARGPLKGCDGPFSDVSMRPLIQVEGILSICCEL